MAVVDWDDDVGPLKHLLAPYERYPPERATPPTPGYVLCVVCKTWLPGDDLWIDFGCDTWGQRYEQGICRNDAPVPAPGGLEPEDEEGALHGRYG